MRIGELLVEQRKLSGTDLTRALAEKPSDTRLCSYLIAKGLVEFDDASRALGEQRQIACALSKHLAGRDPELAKLLPHDVGRNSCALPIGRTSKGSVIVCVRDPSPAVMSALTSAIPGDVMMVIAPADRLEKLVADAYGKAPTGELDIELDFHTSRPAPRRPLSTPPMPLPRATTPAPLPPLPEMDALDPASVRDALIDLDDVRVSKDFSQSDQLPKIQTLPPAAPKQAPRATLPPATKPASELTFPASTSTTIPPWPVTPAEGTPVAKTKIVKRPSTDPGATRERAGSEPRTRAPSEPRPSRAGSDPGATAAELRSLGTDGRPTRPMSLDLMSVGLEHAPNREAATDLVLAYVATRWQCGIVLAVRDKAAIGYRGHGVAAPESVTVSLGSPSTVQRALQTRDVSVETPNGVGQSALSHALNNAKTPAAAPVLVGGQPVAILAVGDPIIAPDRAPSDLKQLADALGAAYQRIHAR